jgi:hypothetical protein
MDRPFARRRFLISLRGCIAVGSVALTRNCWWIFRVNFRLGVKFRPRVNFRPRVKFRNRVKFRPSFVLGGCATCHTEVLRPGGSIASSEQINPSGYVARNIFGQCILSTKSCFRMVGRPMIKSMLVSIVLAIRHGSSSVVCLSLLNKSKLNISFLLLTTVCAPFHVMLTVVGWWCMFEGR